MGIEAEIEELLSKKLALPQEEVQRREDEPQLYREPSKLELKRGLQKFLKAAKEFEFPMDYPKFGMKVEEELDMPLKERVAQIITLRTSLQQDIKRLQTRVNLQERALQALTVEVTQRKIERELLKRQIAEFAEKATPSPWASRERDIRSFINTGVIGFGAILGSAIYATLADFWPVNIGIPVVTASAVFFIALALERVRLGRLPEIALVLKRLSLRHSP